MYVDVDTADGKIMKLIEWGDLQTLAIRILFTGHRFIINCEEVEYLFLHSCNALDWNQSRPRSLYLFITSFQPPPFIT